MKTARHTPVMIPAQGAAMTPRPRGGRGFSLIELLTVISIIGILAAIGAGLAGVASRKNKESATKAGLQKLMTAIEDYRYDFNQYPPDNFLKGPSMSVVNAAVNPLYYELSGTISSQQGRFYQLTDHEEVLSAAQIQNLFHRRGFLNSAEAPDKPKSYLKDLRNRDLGEVEIAGIGHVDLLLAPVDWPLKNAQLKSSAPLQGVVFSDQELRMNPWHYVSTNPTNNLNSFDLWADVWIGKERKIISNFGTE